MKKYEYKFIKVEKIGMFKRDSGDGAFENCKEIILQEAESGWRFKQIVTLFDEITLRYEFIPLRYEVIFEREVD